MDIDYERDMQIDPDAIDVEWMKHPNLTMNYSIASADARKEMDNAKEKLDLEIAKTDLSIRDNLARFLKKYKFDEHTKQTEAVIQKIIVLETLQEEGKLHEANENFKEAKHVYDVIKGALSAIDTKKAALENLARLASMEYFATPSVPRNLSEEWRKRDSNKKTKEVLNKRRERKGR